MTQQAAALAVVEIVRAVTGVAGVPDYPPEQIPPEYFPFVIVYAGSGSNSFGVQGERLFLGEIVVELHVARRDLPLAVQAAIGFGDTIPAALMADNITGTSKLRVAGVDTFITIEQSFGELNWGELDTLGFRFILTGVKMRSTI